MGRLHQRARALLHDDDPYRVLGVARGASVAAAKAAFHARAKRLHPDRNPSPRAAAEFIRVRKAFEAIRDGRLRASQAAETTSLYDPERMAERVKKFQAAAEAAGRATRNAHDADAEPRPIPFLARLDPAAVLALALSAAVRGRGSRRGWGGQRGLGGAFACAVDDGSDCQGEEKNRGGGGGREGFGQQRDGSRAEWRVAGGMVEPRYREVGVARAMESVLLVG